MSKARMRKAREAFRLNHPLVHAAATLADAGDGTHYDQIAAALFVAARDAGRRHREFLAELRRRFLNSWPGDTRQPVAWALYVLSKLEGERRVAPE